VGPFNADHIPMMMWLPPKYAVSQVVCYIKDKFAIHLPVCDQSNRKITGPHLPRFGRGLLKFIAGSEPPPTTIRQPPRPAKASAPARSMSRYTYRRGSARRSPYCDPLGRCKCLVLIPSTSIGFVFGAMVSYVLNRRITFRHQPRFGRGLLKFIAVGAAGLGLNALIVAALAGARLPFILAQMAATAVVLVWNFAIARLVIFRPQTSGG
jgi:GtrA-like protein